MVLAASTGAMETLPHTYTEGDDVPSVVVAFDFDISGFQEITAVVERPDGSAFERAGAVLNSKQVQFSWTTTDWIDGCSQLTVRTINGSGQTSHVPTIIVNTDPKPKAPT